MQGVWSMAILDRQDPTWSNKNGHVSREHWRISEPVENFRAQWHGTTGGWRLFCGTSSTSSCSDAQQLYLIFRCDQRAPRQTLALQWQQAIFSYYSQCISMTLRCSTRLLINARREQKGNSLKRSTCRFSGMCCFTCKAKSIKCKILSNIEKTRLNRGRGSSVGFPTFA